MKSPVRWNPEWDALMGTAPDEDLAARLGLCLRTVVNHRLALGLKPKKRRKVACSGCGGAVARLCRRAGVLCKKCQRKAAAKRKAAWAEQHREYLRKYDREYYDANHEKRRAQWNAWVQENREHHRRVERLYRKRIAREVGQIADELDALCDSCGMTHTEEMRHRVLRRLLPCTSQEIHEAWECIWGPAGKEFKSSAGAQRLRRDLQKLGAQSIGKGNYILPQKASAA